MNETPVGALGGDRDGSKPIPAPGAESEARDLFVALGKALRAYQLYEENNPVYQRFVALLKESFQKLWKTHRELKFAVEETRLVSDGVPIYVGRNAQRPYREVWLPLCSPADTYQPYRRVSEVRGTTGFIRDAN